jgi:hypothetical protein
MELSFHIPNNNTQYIGDENHPPAQVSFFLVMTIIFFTSYVSTDFLSIDFFLGFP